MTTLNEAKELVYARVNANWTDTAITFDREKFTPTANTSYLRVAVRPTGGGASTLGPVGGRRYRRMASVIGQLFVPITSDGTQTIDLLAHTFRTLFEGVKGVTGLRFFDGVVRELPDTGSEHHTNVEVEFDYQERK